MGSLLRRFIREALFKMVPPKRFSKVGSMEIDAPNSREAGEEAAKKAYDQHGIRIDPMTFDAQPISKGPIADDIYLDDAKYFRPPSEYHKRWEVDDDDLPPPVSKAFNDILTMARENWEDEEDAFDAVNRVTYEMSPGKEDVWVLGIHDPQSPVNPSGTDWYFKGDGTFIGWSES